MDVDTKFIKPILNNNFDYYFDNINFPQLVAFISIFLETKHNNLQLDDLHISEDEKDLLHNAYEYSIMISNKEFNLVNNSVYLHCHDYNISYDNYLVVKNWASGMEWKKVKYHYSDFEGNFCKLILRIHNILDEIKTVFSILQKFDLVEMIENNKDSLLREIVQTESLYLF